MNTKIINLTPHKLNIVSESGSLELEPSGNVARVFASYQKAGTFSGVDLYKANYGEVQGLPAPEKGTLYVVSMLVFEASGRDDLACPGELIRDDKGAVVGCRGLRV